MDRNGQKSPKAADQKSNAHKSTTSKRAAGTSDAQDNPNFDDEDRYATGSPGITGQRAVGDGEIPRGGRSNDEARLDDDDDDDRGAARMRGDEPSGGMNIGSRPKPKKRK